jgi:CheY-like chemotaxis protein
VVAASSAEEALSILQRETFDTIFTDYLMPGMRGDELAAEIKKRNPNQPVVMVTAYAEVLHASKTPLQGIDFLIPKPFLLENLREAIAKSTATSPHGPARP